MSSGGSGGFDVLALLDALRSVELIVVGGVAATLHGGPRLTVDLDIVPSPDEQNVRALSEGLESLDAVVREPGHRRIAVTLELLRSTRDTATAGQLRIATRLGPVDVLWRLHDGRGYGELLEGSVVLSDDERQVRVIGIDDLIAVKRDAGRPQDIEDIRYLEWVKANT